MTFSRNFVRTALFKRVASPIALAALASVGVVGVTSPAAAQKQAKPAKPAKADYSKEFIAAYKPVETQATAAGADFNALKPSVPTLVAAAKTADDRMAAGRMILQIGQKTSDNTLSLQGAEMMLASGKADATLAPQLNFAAAQMAYNMKDYAKVRTYAQAAIDAGYSENDPHMLVAEGYFAENKHAEGLKYLGDTIAARKAAGQPVSEAWVKRALATAYNNQLSAEARQWGLMYARDFPSNTSWGDAIAIAINTGDYSPPEMLDLLRLARRTDTIRTKAMYLEYIDAADARKLPNEVIEVLDAGAAKKLVDPNVQIVKEARASAAARLAADKSELPALQRDAGAAGAKLVTVQAAADTLLSYGKWADAETFYNKALALPGANTQLLLTRLGIAQIEQGKYADAQATLAKVTGVRQPIAALWGLYAAQKAAPAPMTAPAAAVTS